MNSKMRTVMAVLLLCASAIIILPQTKAKIGTERRIEYLGQNQLSKQTKSFAQNGEFLNLMSNSSSTFDTLGYHKAIANFNSSFVADGEDIIAIWFVSPQEIKVKAVGLDCAENKLGIGAEVKIVMLNKEWTEDKLGLAGSENLGYWSASNNPSVVKPFQSEVAAPNKWVANSAGATNPFGNDLWSDNGLGAPIILKSDSKPSTYQWIDMNILNNEPIIKKGEIFAVCIKNSGLKENENSFGLWASNQLGYGVFKFYANGRIKGDLTTAGWWKRDFLVNVVVAVEITGDEAPAISDVDILPTTLSKDAREVKAKITDANPNGGPIGVDKGYVEYYLNTDVTWKEVTMTKVSGDIYKGAIPGQQAGTKVTYRIKAKDVLGNVSYSTESYSYNIYAPTPGTKSLLVFNGFDPAEIQKYPMNSYFKLDEPGKAFKWPHDVWAYGALTTELVNNYSNIFEICSNENSGEKIIYNDEVIKIWLLNNGTRNYALAGQEWLGQRYGFVDKDFSVGTFEYDILGITHSYNDVCNNSNSNKPSRVYAKTNSLLGDELYKKFTGWGTDSLQYDPYYELNNTENWIDGFEVVSGQAVDMEVETISVNGAAKKQNSALVTHRVLSGGNKIAFFGYDPIAINTKSPKSNPKYYCFGTKVESPQIKVLQWFNVVTNIQNRDELIPAEIKLFQNYPNPFNPKTSISYSVPKGELIIIKVYDSLGREIKTLINEVKEAGHYTIIFDASELTSGVYFYSLLSGGFIATKKLILLK